jgi:L-rhamnose-H+ transport protein
LETTVLAGIIVTLSAGLIMGLSPAPLKFLRTFKYEQFGFVSMLISLLVIPWSITLLFCPNIAGIMRDMDWGIVLKANIFSFAWGIAQVLALLAFVRIGASLTWGLICAIGASVGVITPMIFKATGVFSESPGLFSNAGIVVLVGILVMLVGVYFASKAGAQREKSATESDSDKSSEKSKSFTFWLILVIVAGIFSAGWGFAFAYSQESIINVVTAHGAADLPSKIAVWAFGLLGAALANIIYPAYLLTKNKSWNVVLRKRRDIFLSITYGLLFFLPSVLLGKGMLLLGALGASVGVGLTQAAIIAGAQILGFSTGEWKGIYGKPRKNIYIAIGILLIAMLLLGLGNLFT